MFFYFFVWQQEFHSLEHKLDLPAQAVTAKIFSAEISDGREVMTNMYLCVNFRRIPGKLHDGFRHGIEEQRIQFFLVTVD